MAVLDFSPGAIKKFCQGIEQRQLFMDEGELQVWIDSLDSVELAIFTAYKNGFVIGARSVIETKLHEGQQVN